MIQRFCRQTRARETWEVFLFFFVLSTFGDSSVGGGFLDFCSPALSLIITLDIDSLIINGVGGGRPVDLLSNLALTADRRLFVPHALGKGVVCWLYARLLRLYILLLRRFYTAFQYLSRVHCPYCSSGCVPVCTRVCLQTFMRAHAQSPAGLLVLASWCKAILANLCVDDTIQLHDSVICVVTNHGRKFHVRQSSTLCPNMDQSKGKQISFGVVRLMLQHGNFGGALVNAF